MEIGNNLADVLKGLMFGVCAVFIVYIIFRR